MAEAAPAPKRGEDRPVAFVDLSQDIQMALRRLYRTDGVVGHAIEKGEFRGTMLETGKLVPSKENKVTQYGFGVLKGSSAADATCLFIERIEAHTKQTGEVMVHVRVFVHETTGCYRVHAWMTKKP